MVALVAGTSCGDSIFAAVLDVVRMEDWTAISMRRITDREAFADFYRRAFRIMLAGVGNQ